MAHHTLNLRLITGQLNPKDLFCPRRIYLCALRRLRAVEREDIPLHGFWEVLLHKLDGVVPGCALDASR